MCKMPEDQGSGKLAQEPQQFVFILTSGSYEDESPIGVYPNLRRAQDQLPVDCEWQALGLMRISEGHVEYRLTTEEEETVWMATYTKTIERPNGKTWSHAESYAIYRMNWDEDITP